MTNLKNWQLNEESEKNHQNCINAELQFSWRSTRKRLAKIFAFVCNEKLNPRVKHECIWPMHFDGFKLPLLYYIQLLHYIRYKLGQQTNILTRCGYFGSFVQARYYIQYSYPYIISNFDWHQAARKNRKDSNEINGNAL